MTGLQTSSRMRQPCHRCHCCGSQLPLAPPASNNRSQRGFVLHHVTRRRWHAEFQFVSSVQTKQYKHYCGAGRGAEGRYRLDSRLGSADGFALVSPWSSGGCCLPQANASQVAPGTLSPLYVCSV